MINFKFVLFSFYPDYLYRFINIFKKIFIKKNYIGPIFLPTKRKRFCILRAPSRYNDSRDQLEIRFYKIIFFIKIKNKKNFIRFFEILYKQLNTLFYTNIKIKIEKL